MALKSAPYDVVKDFTPIALVGKGPLAVSVNKQLPIRNIKELISYAHAHPGKMSFAIGSQASAGHLSTELLKRAGKIDYLVVPYKGSAPAYQDLIGGAIDGFIDPVLGVLSYYKSGMVRVLAVTSKDRSPLCLMCRPLERPCPATSSTAGMACGVHQVCPLKWSSD